MLLLVLRCKNSVGNSSIIGIITDKKEDKNMEIGNQIVNNDDYYKAFGARYKGGIKL